MSAPRWQIVQEILRILQEEVDFSIDPVDDGFVSPIDKKNIKIRKTAGPQRGVNKGFVSDSNFPMIRLTFPFKEDIPIELGTNERDEYRFRFLIQIVDSDNAQPDGGTATYFLWQHRVCQKFLYKQLTDDGNVGACFALCLANMVDVVDETQWVKEEYFKAGVALVVRTWLTRTP